jgi:hypothetical protein
MSTVTFQAAAAGIAGLFEAVQNQLAGLAATDERGRELIRQELAATSGAASPTALTESPSALVRPEVVEDLDERTADQRQDLRKLLDVLREIPRRLGQLGVRHIFDKSSALNHARGDLDGFVGTELRHETSPSSVGSTPSVGDGPVTGGDPAGPGHPQGGAR